MLLEMLANLLVGGRMEAGKDMSSMMGLRTRENMMLEGGPPPQQLQQERLAR